jgi:hypothetical protein
MFLENGAIAQLGERFNGIEEVVGSIPSGSTKTFNKIRSRSGRMLQLRSVSNRQLIATAARNGLWMSHPKTTGTRTSRWSSPPALVPWSGRRGKSRTGPR